MCQPVCLSFLARLTDKPISQVMAEQSLESRGPSEKVTPSRGLQREGVQVFDNETSTLEVRAEPHPTCFSSLGFLAVVHCRPACSGLPMTPSVHPLLLY